VKTVKKLPH